MRTTSRATVLAAATAMAMATLTPAAAATSGVRTFHGTWGGEGSVLVTFSTDDAGNITGCTESTPGEVTGRWSIIVKQDGATALMSSTVLVDGKVHAAWGGWAHNVDRISDEALTISTSDHVMTVDESGATFTIPEIFGSTCTAVVKGTWTH